MHFRWSWRTPQYYIIQEYSYHFISRGIVVFLPRNVRFDDKYHQKQVAFMTQHRRSHEGWQREESVLGTI